ncbi:hypothetical protein [Compostibacter hankyongensis]|uniref:Uncharacterized protein n=1 Tax=Compostibacter hankyongensis TaxID=1007089 RepID=A0ABP8FYL3_9BACT
MSFSLTPEETRLVSDAELLLRKNGIIEKVYGLMGELHRSLEALPQIRSFPFPEGCLARGAKISKGENYRGLPYVILDYPRLFSRESIFAFRTLFWWGHDFICTLHLAGAAYHDYRESLVRQYPLLRSHHFLAATGDDPWVHHPDEEAFVPMEEISADGWGRELEQRSFLKLARRTPLQEWDAVVAEGQHSFGVLLEALGENSGLGV